MKKLSMVFVGIQIQVNIFYCRLNNETILNLEDSKKAATTILSASMDKSMVLWTFDDNQKMYIDKVLIHKR